MYVSYGVLYGVNQYLGAEGTQPDQAKRRQVISPRFYLQVTSLSPIRYNTILL